MLIGIPSRDPFCLTQYLERHPVSSDQHVKKLVSRSEGLHVQMQCYMRQHFADRYWLHEYPGRQALWRESTRRKFTKESTKYFVRGLVCRWNTQKMRSESNQYLRKTTVFFANSWIIKYSLVGLLGRARTRSFGNKLDESWSADHVVEHVFAKLIATILKAFCEQLQEDDQLHTVEEIAAQYQKSLLNTIKSWKKEEDAGTTSMEDICLKILC